MIQPIADRAGLPLAIEPLPPVATAAEPSAFIRTPSANRAGRPAPRIKPKIRILKEAA